MHKIKKKGYYVLNNNPRIPVNKEELNSQNIKKRHNYYDLSGEYGIGYSYKGDVFYFDLDDFNRIKHCTWTSRTGNYFYSTRTVQHPTFHLHRFITNCPPEFEVDHIYGNNYDNRKSQLRVCTHQENSWNRKTDKSNHTSGHKGVCYYKAGSGDKHWRAYITVNGEIKNLGFYYTYKEALNARLKGEVKYYKDIALQGQLELEFNSIKRKQ